MEENLTDKLERQEILHEIAMAIGSSLDMTRMLKGCLPIFLRRLGCSIASVIEVEETESATVLTLPRQADPGDLDPAIRDFRAGRPFEAPHAIRAERVDYLWRLDGFGLLLLGRRSAFPHSLVQELGLLADKLAVALQGCRQHQRLRTARSQLTAVFESAGQGIIVVDEAGTVHQFNPAAEAIFGYRAAEMVGDNVRRLVPEPHASGHDTYIAGFLADPEARARGLRHEVRGVRADGSHFPLELSVTDTGLSDPHLLVGVARDLSEQKAAEAALQEQLARLGSFLETALDGVVSMDEDGCIVDFNPAAERLFGHRAEAVRGRRLGDVIVPARYRDAHAQGLRRYLETRESDIMGERLTLSALHADGSEFPVELSINAVELSGRPFFTAFIRDISARRRAEQEARFKREAAEARARIGSLLQRQEPIMERFQQVLRYLAEMEGLTGTGQAAIFLHDEQSNRLEPYLLHGEFSEAIQADPPPVPLDGNLADQALRLGEVQVSPDCHRENGPDRLLETRRRHGHYFIPLKQSETVYGILSLYTEPEPPRDGERLATLALIGEQMGQAMANERLQKDKDRARREAEAMAEARSHFLANMSHEIRTPMQGILGMLDLLRHSDLGPEARQYASTAQRSAEMLLNIINGILDFSRVEAGRLTLDEGEFHLTRCVEDVAALLAERAHQKGLELNCVVRAGVPGLVRGDELRLRQVLVNLTGNAIKFTEAGEVRLAVSCQERREDRVRLRFEVIDTGIGFDMARKEQLFESFSQADASTSRHYGGTGLGLAISREIVQLMGGTLDADSTPGKGSCFWFEIDLPLEADMPAKGDGLAGHHALIVDDNETNRAILGHYLEDWGVTCETFGDGRPALDRLRDPAARLPDIALLDLQMPEMDGVELARHLRAEVTPGLPLVLLTSLTRSPEEAHEGLFDAVQTKPVRREGLHDTLAHLLHGRPSAATGAAEPDTPRGDAGLGGHVLLVEDNAVNQMVGREQLHRLGLTVTLASNGREALERAAEEPHDAILMDCQMPVMDGFEATAALRGRETGGQRTPIIALTANAHEEDRQRCLAVGMDDFLAKPFTPWDLESRLRRWLLPDDGGADHATGSDGEGGEAAGPVLDDATVATLRDMMGASFGALVAEFRTSSAALLDQLETAAEGGDTGTLYTAAHTLKSSSGNLGGTALYQASLELERQARDGSVDDPATWLATLRERRDQLLTELEKLT